MSKTGIIILAAGNSSRLGRPKQLLPYRGKTLLSHVVDESVMADLKPVIVITGAYHTEIRGSLEGRSSELVFNPEWQKGMASGIVAGLQRAMVIESALQSVIIAVCDQPYISGNLFRALIGEWTVSGKGVIACSYAETVGTPVLFGQKYFTELALLSGEAGAKQLLKRYPYDVGTIPFPKGNIDIDTEKDLKEF
jgi:molybdenum cofactor cytidylyltransferase